ncbi:MAG: NAD(P)/FAD-dependent oxidoreductase [Deltaproteobacteria bacterium]|nr:NAD(P)/FAD-dependent oxidoreductase [Deltaproteobacteria bacterium]
MRIGTSYKQHGCTGEYDAIVIGSGIGGLTTAALMATHADKRVLVLERHYTAGGFTHTFRRKGYEWDVGVHYIGEVHDERAEVRRVFDDITDGQLKWADMGEVYDCIVIGEDKYDLVKGRKNFIAKLTEYFPEEEDNIKEYVRRVKQTIKDGQFYFLDKALPGPVSAVLGPLLRRKAMKASGQTVGEVLAEITDNKRLRAVLAGQYGDYGLSPKDGSFFIHCMVVNHYFEGGAYPIGGSARIAETILPVIEQAGGKVLTNAPVDEVIVKKGRAVGVRLEDGKELFAPVIISNAGVVNTINRLLPEQVAKKYGFDQRVKNVEPSVAHMSLYIGSKKTASELNLEKRNLWVYPGEDHDASIENFLADPDNNPLPVAYLSFPSAKDPSFEERYPGKATLEVVSLAPFDWFKKWEDTKWKKRGDDYDALKEKYTQRMLEALYKQCPQLEGNIDYLELSTPLSTKTFASFASGEIYGLSHTPDRFKELWLRPRTPIKGFYLTGVDICSCGVAGGMFGGVLTASAVTLKDMRGAIIKRRASQDGRWNEPVPAG